MPTSGVCMNIINARQKKGYGTVTNPISFLNQDYEQMKQYCLSRRVRYIDDMFPPDSNTIGQGLLEPTDMDRVVWLRPAVSGVVAEKRGLSITVIQVYG